MFVRVFGIEGTWDVVSRIFDVLWRIRCRLCILMGVSWFRLEVCRSVIVKRERRSLGKLARANRFGLESAA
jgi:hypothetical protein